MVEETDSMRTEASHGEHNEKKRSFFNRLAAVWDEMGSERRRDEGVEAFVEASLSGEAQTILDVGCGTGVLAPHLLSAYPQARVIIELDFAEEMLALNRGKHRDPRLVRLAADARSLPFPDGSIDLILCYNAAPHLGQDEEAFRDLFRALAPGGKVAIGHLMSSEELNRFHASLHGRPVLHDRLPPATALGEIMKRLGGVQIVVEERSRWYFVQATKAD